MGESIYDEYNRGQLEKSGGNCLGESVGGEGVLICDF